MSAWWRNLMSKFHRLFTTEPNAARVEETAVVDRDVEFNKRVLDMTIRRSEQLSEEITRKAHRDMERTNGLLASTMDAVEILQRAARG